MNEKPRSGGLGGFIAQAFKFGAVGLLNTALTFAVFALFTRVLGIDIFWANAAGFAVGFVNSFIWNKLWTFKSSRFMVSEFLLFALVALVAYGVQLPFFALFNAWRMDENVAELLAMVPYTIVGFIGNKFITFKKGSSMKNTAKDRPITLITGASSGIGEALAREMARMGYPVALAARSLGKLEALAEDLAREHGVKTWALKADLSAPGAAAALRAECAKLGVEPGILVNNAGTGLFGEAVTQAEGASAADLRSMIALNVVSLTELCVLFGRDMAARGSGTILNVASMVALMPVPFFAAYAATKAYVKSLSASLRAELRPRGVTVSCLYPGYVKTNFDAASHADNEAYVKMSGSMGMPPERVARIAARQIETGKANKVTGAMNSVAAAFIGFLPKGLIARITHSYLKRLLGK